MKGRYGGVCSTNEICAHVTRVIHILFKEYSYFKILKLFSCQYIIPHGSELAINYSSYPLSWNIVFYNFLMKGELFLVFKNKERTNRTNIIILKISQCFFRAARISTTGPDGTKLEWESRRLQHTVYAAPGITDPRGPLQKRVPSILRVGHEGTENTLRTTLSHSI